MEPTKCALCFIKYSPNQRNSERTFNTEEVRKQNNIYGANGDDLINGQLEIIFLLRKILEIPQEKCCDFLVDHGNPCSWMNCCPSCSDLVEKGKMIFNQMILLQNQFKKVQNEIKRTLILSVCENDVADDECKWGVQETVRSFISQGASGLIIASQNEVKDEKTFYSDLNDASFEQLNCFPGPSRLTSDFVETHNRWGEVGVEDPDFHVSYDSDNVTFGTQDPLAPDSATGGEHFVNIFNIKEEAEPCYLIENEQNISNDAKDPLTEGKDEYVNSVKDRSNSPSEQKHIKLCRFCGKGCKNISLLDRHERIHTGERPFHCSFCAKSFTDSNGLKRHERIHTGERPYECGFCEKRFKDKNSVNVHERTHTGEKPYQCGICGKTFGNPSNCNTHKRIHSVHFGKNRSRKGHT